MNQSSKTSSAVNNIVFSKFAFQDTDSMYKMLSTELEVLLAAGYATILKYVDQTKNEILIEYSPDVPAHLQLPEAQYPVWLSLAESSLISRLRPLAAADPNFYKRLKENIDNYIKDYKEGKNKKLDA